MFPVLGERATEVASPELDRELFPRVTPSPHSIPPPSRQDSLKGAEPSGAPRICQSNGLAGPTRAETHAKAPARRFPIERTSEDLIGALQGRMRVRGNVLSMETAWTREHRIRKSRVVPLA